MKKQVRVMLMVVAFLGLSTSVFAYTAKEKLMAKRAAKMDAYRMLSERVKGVQIDSETFVSDMVTESDEIGAEFENFLKGAEPSSVNFNDADGVCEVTMEMGLSKIIDELKLIQKHHRAGNKFQVDWVSRYTQDKVVTVKGYGAVADSPGQKRLRAYRAALLDAYRNILETINGLKLSGTSYVRDFVLESDTVKSEMHHFLKGARVVSTTWDTDDSCKVRIEVTLQQTIAKLKNLHKHKYLGHKDYQFEKIDVYTKEKAVSAIGEGVPREDTQKEWSEFFGEKTSGPGGEKEVVVDEEIVVE